MRQKIIYIAFILVTIFLLVFINRKPENTVKPAIEKNSQEFSVELGSISGRHTETILPLTGKPRVTIIKKAVPKKEESILPQNKEITLPSPKKEALSSSSTASSAKEDTQTASEKPVAGVTKIGKRPTNAQSNEMNAQGIVLY